MKSIFEKIRRNPKRIERLKKLARKRYQEYLLVWDSSPFGGPYASYSELVATINVWWGRYTRIRDRLKRLGVTLPGPYPRK
jgi:hypothetical protein